MTAKKDRTPASDQPAPHKRTKAVAMPDATPAGASEPAPASAGTEGCATLKRVVVFRMQEQRYALPIEAVQEIQQLVAISELPDASPAVVGVINLRGDVVPAVDLRLLVGLPREEYGLQTPMLFVRTVRGLVALIVDEVEDVMEVPPGAAQPTSSMYALSEYLLCVVRLDGGIVFVFDVDKLVPQQPIDTAGGLT